MIFITLLALGAFLLATVSGFFSVWGLALTYSGIFWFVIAMGIAIEYGKLVAVSFIYRYWNTGPRLLSMYLISAVCTVMLVTAAGHYGFLTSGYQTDSLPLKQMQAKVELLEKERIRISDRKVQIDTQISQLPTNSVKGRVRLIKQFKSEQESTTVRLNDIDQQLLTLKQSQITVEAHTGPIVFLAKAFNVDTDVATHYLTLLLILVFDPMAVALTWATNVAIRLRDQESKPVTTEDIPVTSSSIPPVEVIPVDEPEPIADEIVEPIPEPELVADEIVEPIPEPVKKQESTIIPTRVTRMYNGLADQSQQDIGKLLTHYRYLSSKKNNNNPDDIFTNDDAWEMSAIEELLRKQGLGHYLTM